MAKTIEHFKKKIDILKKNGYSPIGVTIFGFEDTFIFKTDEEALIAYAQFERNPINEKEKIIAWWYGKEEFLRQSKDCNKINVFWLDEYYKNKKMQEKSFCFREEEIERIIEGAKILGLSLFSGMKKENIKNDIIFTHPKSTKLIYIERSSFELYGLDIKKDSVFEIIFVFMLKYIEEITYVDYGEET